MRRPVDAVDDDAGVGRVLVREIRDVAVRVRFEFVGVVAAAHLPLKLVRPGLRRITKNSRLYSSFEYHSSRFANFTMVSCGIIGFSHVFLLFFRDRNDSECRGVKGLDKPWFNLERFYSI